MKSFGVTYHSIDVVALIILSVRSILNSSPDGLRDWLSMRVFLMCPLLAYHFDDQSF